MGGNPLAVAQMFTVDVDVGDAVEHQHHDHQDRQADQRQQATHPFSPNSSVAETNAGDAARLHAHTRLSRAGGG